MTSLLFALALQVAAQVAAQAEAPPPPDHLEPDDGDRATAATASGACTFVGLVVGGLGAPTAFGLLKFGATNVGATNDELLTAAVIGGTGGAAVGGFAGAATTTTWTGIAAVPAVAAAGALAGLLPASIFGRAVLVDGDDSQAIFQSAAVLAAIALGAGGAAATGAWLAEADAPPPRPASPTPSSAR